MLILQKLLQKLSKKKLFKKTLGVPNAKSVTLKKYLWDELWIIFA